MKNLKLKVEAVNKAGEIANRLYDDMVAMFTPLVGQKIFKADGSFMAKIAKNLPTMPNTPDICIYNHNSEYSLAWSVSVTVWNDNGSERQDETVYIGNIRNGVLTGTIQKHVRRTDRTVEEVEFGRRKVAELKDALAEAKRFIRDFGE